jgi:GH35 family endo-1,4-beta-xylanase
VRVCRAEPACRSLSFWGLTDPQSYVNQGYAPWLEQDEDWPLLFDADHQPKPACTAVARALIE